MDVLHKDIRGVIIRYINILDLVNWSRVNKFSYNIIASSFDTYVYDIALNSKINIKGINMINTNQYYTLYDKNIKFELNLNEVFLYIKKNHKCIVMGTFMKNVGYIIYYFHNEVGFNIKVLKKHDVYDNLNNYMKNLDNIDYNVKKIINNALWDKLK
jgi:hypothetical protein